MSYRNSRKYEKQESMDELHRQFPECKKIVDEFRRVFGKVHVKYLEENGRSVGNDPRHSSKKRDG